MTATMTEMNLLDYGFEELSNDELQAVEGGGAKEVAAAAAAAAAISPVGLGIIAVVGVGWVAYQLGTGFGKALYYITH
jgi:bacteriocin-like protein